MFLGRHGRDQKQDHWPRSITAVLARLGRAAGATALGVTAGFAGSSSPTASSATNLAAAESVAASFVAGFESFSYQDPGTKASVTDLATAGLAAQLVSPSQAASGPALVAEKYTAVARVVGFVTESDTSTTVALLARTVIHVTTVKGSASTTRLVPVSLVLTAGVWKVAGVDGLSVLSSPSAPTTTIPPGSGPTSTTTTSAGGTTGTTNPTPGSPNGTAPVVTAVGDAPAAYVGWMKAAVATECPGLPWTVLAGIAKVESDFGKSSLPGVRSGSNPMGAQGPMQFEPATFAAYGTVAPGGTDPASPYDPADAIYSAAHLLCADGGGNPARLYSAIFDYNHSDAYVSLVLAYSAQYAQLASDGGTSAPERGLGSVIVADAERYLGTPYVWGGESPGHGFDCSGLVQWVYAEAGISLPRVAQDQYDAGPHLPAGAPLYPGDLVFFGSGPSAVEHVGIYVGNGEMIDAPYTGAVVRFDRLAGVPLGFVGATRPEIPDLSGGAGVPVIGTVNGSGSGGGHQSSDHGPSSSGVGHHGGAQSNSATAPPPRRRRPPSTTEPPGPTTIRHGRRYSIPSTTTTTTTVPLDTTTSSTVPGTTSHPGRHHQTTTTTSVPPTTTTTTMPAPTTTVPSATTSTTAATTGTSSTTADNATTTTPPAGRHHHG